jgi:SPP1 gp7 family putative phage head morphogenesis protein
MALYDDIDREALARQEDCFGLAAPNYGLTVQTETSSGIPGWRAFAFPRSADKVAAFMEWIEQQVALGILEIHEGHQLGHAVEPAWANKYVTSAYQKGILQKTSAYGGAAAAFNQPFHLDSVGLIYTRAFQELKGITAAMDTQISRVLAQGMADGKNPRVIARILVKTVNGPAGDLSMTDTLGRFIPAQRRAQLLAGTEIIRAHHVATIQEYRNWGVAGVEVEAEWRTAGDGRVCPSCAWLQGQVFSLDAIEGMIPRHPLCRCVALPVKKGTRRAALRR